MNPSATEKKTEQWSSSAVATDAKYQTEWTGKSTSQENQGDGQKTRRTESGRRVPSGRDNLRQRAEQERQKSKIRWLLKPTNEPKASGNQISPGQEAAAPNGFKTKTNFYNSA
jgi:hypothetical protein